MSISRKSKAAEPHVGPGVYLLFKARRLTYVGRSAYPPGRIAQHRANGRPFSHSMIIPCSEEDSYWVEKALIDALQPPQNRAGVREPRCDDVDTPTIIERIVIRDPAPPPPRLTWEPTPAPVISLSKARDLVSSHKLNKEFSAAVESGDIVTFYANPSFVGKGNRRLVERADVLAWIKARQDARKGVVAVAREA